MDDIIDIRIKYLSAVRDKVGHREEHASFPENSSLKEVRNWLNKRYSLSLPDAAVMSTLNGIGWDQLPQKLSTKIKHGDIICIFPVISGG